MDGRRKNHVRLIPPCPSYTGVKLSFLFCRDKKLMDQGLASKEVESYVKVLTRKEADETSPINCNNLCKQQFTKL